MRTKALVNGRVFDGASGRAIEQGTVVIDGAMIKRVGPANQIVVPDGCEVIDCTGKTVLPGLIDGHMHVTRMPGELNHLEHVRTTLQAVGKLQKCLAWGTTTVGHAAGSAQSVILGETIRAGTIAGCADLIVGGAVTATCGHVRGLSADGPWEVRKAVRKMIGAGAGFIKTCASGGFQWEHEQLSYVDYTVDELRAMVDEAHGKGKLVHVHAHAQPGLANAIDAGCDVILHGAHIDDEALAGIAEKNLIYMPTLYITSAPVINSPSRPAFMRERMKRAHPVHRAGVAKAQQMGIKIAGGTDGGPGSINIELAEMVACGLSPAEAIVAATRNNADAMGIGEKTGTLQAGKRADSVVIDGDPLADISVLCSQEAIMMVIKAGKVEAKKE